MRYPEAQHDAFRCGANPEPRVSACAVPQMLESSRLAKHGPADRLARDCRRPFGPVATGITMLLYFVAAAPAGEPTAYHELTIHGKPKPLAADAVTEDWPGFLGPRRDGTSRETKLFKSFGNGGPKLVWEMSRGSGYAAPAGCAAYPAPWSKAGSSRGASRRVRT